MRDAGTSVPNEDLSDGRGAAEEQSQGGAEAACCGAELSMLKAELHTLRVRVEVLEMVHAPQEPVDEPVEAPQPRR